MKKPECTCENPEVVYNEIRGKGFWYCRGCKQEVLEKYDDVEYWKMGDEDGWPM